MARGFEKLVTISRMKYLQDQKTWSQHMQRRDDLEKIIHRLDESRNLSSRDSVQPLMQKQSFHWGRWIDDMQATVNMELFTEVAKEDATREKLKASFGQHLAIEALVKKLK